MQKLLVTVAVSAAALTVVFSAVAIYTVSKEQERVEKRDRFVDNLCGELAETVAHYKRTTEFAKFVDELRQDTELSTDDYLNKLRLELSFRILPAFEQRLKEQKQQFSDDDFEIIVGRLHTFVQRVIH